MWLVMKFVNRSVVMQHSQVNNYIYGRCDANQNQRDINYGAADYKVTTYESC